MQGRNRINNDARIGNNSNGNNIFQNSQIMNPTIITGSGTAAMEATVMNVFNESDKLLVVNGGGFGQRFVDLCKLHNIPHDYHNKAFLVSSILHLAFLHLHI